jgi:hypothetical protein
MARARLLTNLQPARHEPNGARPRRRRPVAGRSVARPKPLHDLDHDQHSRNLPAVSGCAPITSDGWRSAVRRTGAAVAVNGAVRLAPIVLHGAPLITTVVCTSFAASTVAASVAAPPEVTVSTTSRASVITAPLGSFGPRSGIVLTAPPSSANE